MKRRHTLGLLAAGIAAAAGGLAWRLANEPADPAAAGSSPAGGELPHAGLWQMRFTQPDGSELAMSSLRGRPLLLNFWATWCPPCVKEMPELDQFRPLLQARGGEVLGLALDGPTPVREFLRRTPVSYPIALAGLQGSDLGRQLGNDRGGLPFTVLLGAGGQVLQRKSGETTAAELQGWLPLL